MQVPRGGDADFQNLVEDWVDCSSFIVCVIQIVLEVIHHHALGHLGLGSPPRPFRGEFVGVRAVRGGDGDVRRGVHGSKKCRPARRGVGRRRRRNAARLQRRPRRRRQRRNRRRWGVGGRRSVGGRSVVEPPQVGFQLRKVRPQRVVLRRGCRGRRQSLDGKLEARVVDALLVAAEAREGPVQEREDGGLVAGAQLGLQVLGGPSGHAELKHLEQAQRLGRRIPVRRHGRVDFR
mmetsp:Transcript_12455/g.41519  ORF Transcript_12455/g.41519 Transcript_12455/m.41519 type:complete len:234 (-) Transcript_12455:208-909(-)